MKAIVRPPSAAYARCLREKPVPIDVAKAALQHAGYVAALRACGVEVEALPPEPDLPDACFVEDTAVIVGDRALIARPGAPVRRPELASIEQRLSKTHRCVRLEEGTLDGGDVMILGRVAYVGLSTRTNAVAALGRLLDLDARPVTVGALHLKSIATPIGERTILAEPGLRFDDFEVVTTDEPHGANVLWLGRHILVSAAAPRTARLLAKRGLDVRVVDVGEFHKGDAGVTCLSLILGA